MSTDLTQTDDTRDVKTEVLLADLSRAAEFRFRLNRWFGPLFGLGAFYLLGHGLYGTLLHLPVSEAYAPTVALLYKVAVGIVSLSWMPEFFLWKRIKKRKAWLKALVEELSEDTRAVGALAQLCRSTQVLSVADIALDPLLKLLPNVKAGDARYISDRQMEALLDLLVIRMQDRTRERCRELPLALLKTLQQIGDSRAVEPVRRLTRGRNNRPYHQAAQECLAFLEQQGAEREYHRTLLLPASAETGQETLLRAALPQAEAQPELLLRAANSEERG